MVVGAPGSCVGGITRRQHDCVESAWTYRHPPANWTRKTMQAGASTAQSPRDRLESTGAPNLAILGALRAREKTNRCLYSNRPRAGRVQVGRRSGDAIRPNVTTLTEQSSRTGGGGADGRETPG